MQFANMQNIATATAPRTPENCARQLVQHVFLANTHRIVTFDETFEENTNTVVSATKFATSSANALIKATSQATSRVITQSVPGYAEDAEEHSGLDRCALLILSQKDSQVEVYFYFSETQQEDDTSSTLFELPHEPPLNESPHESPHDHTRFLLATPLTVEYLPHLPPVVSPNLNLSRGTKRRLMFSSPPQFNP